tara:strand:+ start:771 stop:974 length:204 start_codon:yes stop_codon:yes gene_type:complete
MNNMIYNGQYENEGHTVTFLVSLDDTVIIKEMYISGINVSNTERTELLSSAIEFQTELVKLGYDKVS